MSANKPKDKFININGLRLHYLEWGNRTHQTILLLHGIMGHGHVWDDFAERLCPYYHLLALDQRGHGDSQWSQKAHYTIDDYFSDITVFIDLLKLKDIILLGHSMGGRNALFYAACNPERVRRLILVEARCAATAHAANALKQLFRHFLLEAGGLGEVVAEIRKLYPLVSENICRHLVRHGYRQLESGQWAPKYDVRMSIAAKRSGYRAEDLRQFMKNIRCDTLIVRGQDSSFLSRQDVQEMCAIIPQAEYKEIPQSTHMPVQENPDAFEQMILEFMGPRNGS